MIKTKKEANKQLSELSGGSMGKPTTLKDIDGGLWSVSYGPRGKATHLESDNGFLVSVEGDFESEMAREAYCELLAETLNGGGV